MISTLLKKVMTERGLSQTQLAEVMEVKVQRVRDLASGRAKKLSREESEHLVGKLDIRAEWLITGEGPMLQDHESQEVFVDRMRAINLAQAMIDAMPFFSEKTKLRLGVLMTGDPKVDGEMIAAAIRSEGAGGVTSASSDLKPDEAALLDNYRHSPPEGQAAIRTTSAALAKPCAPVKKTG